MSGPKISVYDLAPEARENLREQLECDRRGLVCVRQVEALLREISGDHFRIVDALELLRVLNARAGGDSRALEELEELENGFGENLREMRTLLQENRLQTTGRYVITEEVLAEKREKLGRIEALKERTQEYVRKVRRLAEQGKNSASASARAAESGIGRELGGILSFEIERPSKEEVFVREKSVQKKRLQTLASDAPETMKKEIHNALAALERISSARHLSTFTGLTVDPLIQRCAEENARIAVLREEFVGMQLRRESLCTLLDAQAKEIPFSEEGLEAMRNEIRSMEHALVQRCEQEYISACVDEVMAEMGYDMIGSRDVTKRSGRRFRNALYTFEEGTAVNVTYAEDGQISMELGGISHEDRIPTAAETEMLCADMESFCEDFAEVERRLEKKGVLLGRRISLAPPSGEYAAIINVDDYELKQNRELAEIRAVGRRRKSSAEKTMRRSEG